MVAGAAVVTELARESAASCSRNGNREMDG